MVVLALGANDLKSDYKREAKDICSGLAELIKIIQTSHKTKPPQILILSLPQLDKVIEQRDSMFAGALKKAAELPRLLYRLAAEKGCELLDISKTVKASQVDGLHLDSEGHRKISELVHQKIQSMLMKPSPCCTIL